jgi:hypothetical protein
MFFHSFGKYQISKNSFIWKLLYIYSEAAVTSTKTELSLSQAAITATKTELGLSKVASTAIKNQSRFFHCCTYVPRRLFIPALQ